MTIPVLVRPLALSETSFVLSSWKKQLNDERYRHRWGKGLDGLCFWMLINHVIDKITLPSCEVFVGCERSEPGTPLCWVAVRKIKGLSTFDIVYLYARHEIRKDQKLAAYLEVALLSEVNKTRPFASQRRSFNPFRELQS